MSSITIRFVLSLTALSLTACDARNAFFVKDSEGVSYRVSCLKTSCPVEVETPKGAFPGRVCGAGEHAAVTLAGRKVLTACHVCAGKGAEIDPTRCRAIVCNAKQDCPPYRGSDPVDCVHGLCEVPSEPALDRASAVSLCMMGAGAVAAGEAHRTADRVAMTARACDANGACSAPAGCKEP